MNSRHICIVMCKAPEQGKVKTRLAASVGDHVAVRVYTAMLEHIVGQLSTAECKVVMSVDGNTDLLPPHDFGMYQQRGNSLGDRICNAVVDAGNFDRCIVIGADAPFIDSEVLSNTLALLQSSDVVVGPSLDGGYYLIGFNEFNAEIFRNISWSSEHVLMQTLERCTEQGLAAVLTPAMIDVDKLGDILMLEAPSKAHDTIVSQLRALVMMVLAFALCSVASTAEGGWVREQGQLFGKVAYQTLGTSSTYDLNGTKFTTSKYSLWSASLYAEYGLIKNLMVVLNAPLYRSSKIADYDAVGNIGDLAFDVRYGLVEGDWPVSIGVGFELPTGDEKAIAVWNINNPLIDPPINSPRLPTGDGELNMWINAGISHSFWPTEAFVSIDAGYNIRGLSASDYTRKFDNGQFTNQYRASIKGGYKVLSPLWVTLSVYRFATAGTPRSGRFSFNGLGEGVEYNAWDLGLIYEIDNVLSFSADASSAFTTPRAIYGGLNVFVGAMIRI